MSKLVPRSPRMLEDRGRAYVKFNGKKVLLRHHSARGGPSPVKPEALGSVDSSEVVERTHSRKGHGMNTSRWIRALTALACLAGAAAGEMAAEPVDIGDRRELMVDRHLIGEMRGGAELRLHRPAREEVVFRANKPWEGNTSGYFTIFRDGETVRMYYRGSHAGQPKHPQYVCYAESPDGIRWTRPELGLVEFGGSKKNNILLEGVGAHNFVPFKDPNPDTSSEARYKAIGRSGGEHQKHGLYAFQSADGIHWELMREEPIITKGAFDSQNLAFWDPVRKEYRVYLRDFRDGRRGIRTATSDDFIHWTEPEWLEYGDAPAEHLYTNQVRPYHRAPHLFIGFPTRYRPDRGSAVEGLFMTSRDGLHFRRWGEAFIRAGRNDAQWGNRSNYIWHGLIETPSDLPGSPTELSLYANEAYYEGEGSHLRRYTLRPDGFVSVQTPMRGGEMVTRPFTFEGEKLVLNASTSAAGSIRVEVQDAAGNAIDGYRLEQCPEHYGDKISWTVRWKKGTDLSPLAGEPIRLRFKLKDADLYALWFE